jgi:hypothetical protein
MTVIQEKTINEVLAREPQSYAPASRLTNGREPDPTRYLRIALRLVGSDLYRRDLHIRYRLAGRLVPAPRKFASSATLPADDSRGLRNPGHVSVDCEPEAAGTFEPYLVHGVVQRSACGHYGSAVFGEL